MPGTRLAVQIDAGRLDITTADRALLQGCCAAVELSDGRRYATEGGTCEHPATDQWLVRCGGDTQRPELRWHIEREPDGCALRWYVELKNTTDRTLAVERLDVLVAPTGLRQVPLAELAVAHTGWQSWSYTSPPVPLDPVRSAAPPPIFGPNLPPVAAEVMRLPWMTQMHAGGAALLIGFISARDQLGLIVLQPAPVGHHLAAAAYSEGVAIPPGSTLRSETLLLLGEHDDQAALERYAETLAQTMQARPWPSVPTGWCSWYCYETAVSEANILHNLEHLAAARRHMPLEYIQLDDGYQQQIGDWLALTDTFSGGMRALTDAIRAHGFKPGIWIAPFLVAESSTVYAEHPDWLVRDEQGAPLVAIHNWATQNYALDTTHPAAMDWLRQVITTLLDGWGFEYLKIDFVYAAALRGIRYDRAVTSVQAYRRGVQLIRDIAGDRFVLGCGAPLAPSVGLVDGMRIGPDVAPIWRREPDADGVVRGHYRAVRSTLAHGWMHQRLWTNDPDCLLVRVHDSQLSLAEVQSWAALVALSGGMVLLGDDVSRLEPERAAIVTATLPPLGVAATPLPPYDGDLPTRMQLVVERPWERWLVAGIFNWQSAPQELHFDPAVWDLDADAPYHLFDVWSGEHWGPQTGPTALPSTPAHGARLLCVHRHLDRPQVLGSTLHLLGGAVELADESWSDLCLRLTLRCQGERSGQLVVHVPAPFIYQQPDDANGIRRGAALHLPIYLIDQAEITLRFQLTETHT